MADMAIGGASKLAGMPDTLVLDCEDGVAASRKREAREGIHQQLHSSSSLRVYRDQLKRSVLVRVNPTSSGGSLIEEDVKMCLDVHKYLDYVCLPKTESVDELNWLADQLKNAPSVGIMGMIESPQALEAMPAICSVKDKVPLVGFVFGSDDYCASVGLTRSSDNVEIDYARNCFVTRCKAHGLIAIDMVDIDLDEQHEKRVRENIRLGAQLGFDGKQLIHPKQIALTHEAFTPSEATITWSRELLKAAEQMHNLNEDAMSAGAFIFQGRMIDRPTVRQAKNVVAKAQLLLI